ncbi:MAG TPA: aminopeptidase P family protein [Sphingobacteriaceae bacterium]|nr:aminopeptidase P family protein [Sphingobacteriaceae bacterium]
MTYKEKLLLIRQAMNNDGVYAYIIPSSDPHMSEYLPDRFKCLEFACGFTGSAGTLVITAKEANLWTDARYFVQATEQLERTGYKLMALHAQGVPEYIQWLSGNMEHGASVAFDGKLVSFQLAELIKTELNGLNANIVSDKDYLEAIWINRPALPQKPAYLIDELIAGENVIDKLIKVRAFLKNMRADYHLISSLDDLAWLFNIRGSDVKCNPVTLAFALISHDKAIIFIELSKIKEEDRSYLSDSGVSISSYNDIYTVVKSIASGSIFIDPKRTCFELVQQINASVKVIQGTNPTTNLKAIKNLVEIENTRKTMIKDGVALTRFFKWLEEAVNSGQLTEISVAKILLGFREEQAGFVGESFDTISAYREHGALPHYKATTQSSTELKPEGLFLLDSGGQYIGGTTDVTRVISLGNATDEEKTDYTLVLKGMIEGCSAIFPKGTRGYQIDAITRKPIWDQARNYGHGTGHGVGYFLNVHEGPHVFNTAAIPVDIEPGMITSIEPGIYRPGKYGIRIENLVLSVKDQINEFGEFYAFEALTLAVIDTGLVMSALLEQRHIDWLNQYNQQVVEKLSGYLDSEELKWLTNKARPI